MKKLILVLVLVLISGVARVGVCQETYTSEPGLKIGENTSAIEFEGQLGGDQPEDRLNGADQGSPFSDSGSVSEKASASPVVIRAAETSSNILIRPRSITPRKAPPPTIITDPTPAKKGASFRSVVRQVSEGEFER